MPDRPCLPWRPWVANANIEEAKVIITRSGIGIERYQASVVIAPRLHDSKYFTGTRSFNPVGVVGANLPLGQHVKMGGIGGWPPKYSHVGRLWLAIAVFSMKGKNFSEAWEIRARIIWMEGEAVQSDFKASPPKSLADDVDEVEKRIRQELVVLQHVNLTAHFVDEDPPAAVPGVRKEIGARFARPAARVVRIWKNGDNLDPNAHRAKRDGIGDRIELRPDIRVNRNQTQDNKCQSNWYSPISRRKSHSFVIFVRISRMLSEPGLIMNRWMQRATVPAGKAAQHGWDRAAADNILDPPAHHHWNGIH